MERVRLVGVVVAMGAALLAFVPSARAQPLLPGAEPTPMRVDGAAVTTTGGGALAFTLAGGTPPYTVRLNVAAAGGVWEVVEGAAQPGPVVEVPLPATARARPFQWYATVADAAGQQVAVGDALAPHTHATAEPPPPDGPPALPPTPADTVPPPDADPQAQPDRSRDPPHPPMASGQRRRADPSRDNETRQRAPRRKVKTQRVVEVCGVPVFGAGRNPLLLVGAAVSLLAGFITAGVALLFALDLSLAQRMILTVDRAERRGDALPDRCATYADCRAPYIRAFWMDVGGIVVSALVTLGLGVLAAGFLVAAVMFRRE